MIAIVDYSMGNVGSIRRMLKKAGADSMLTSCPERLRSADKLILPGVGAFDAGMHHLCESGVKELLDELVLEQHKPLLGICLGMQLLMDSSEEGTVSGLGWISGRVKRFDWSENRKTFRIPHMGWNLVCPKNDSPLFRGLDAQSRFYFVHSFFAVPQDDASRVAATRYGFEFCSAVRKNHIHGVQFHPEKSHRYGLRLLQNFVEL